MRKMGLGLPPRGFRASLEDLALEGILEIFVRSKATGLLVVEGEGVDGELLWEEGRLYDASVIYPKRATGRRALDYLLGLRRGEVHLESARISRLPTLAGDLLDLAFAIERAKVWARASRLPLDWGLVVFPRGKAGPLDPLLAKAKGKTLAEVLLLYEGLPSTVASVLSSLAGAGLVAFRPKEGRRLLFRWPWGGPRASPGKAHPEDFSYPRAGDLGVALVDLEADKGPPL